jgi:hypothetical protein
LITAFLSLVSFVLFLSLFPFLPPLILILASRRALASGQTYLTKNALVKSDINVASCAAPAVNNSKP